MALIKCKECGKEISDTATKCPNCGYKIKENINLKKVKTQILNIFKENQEYELFNKKIKISAMQILSLVAVVCAVILSTLDICFSRKVYRLSNYSISQITAQSFLSINDIVMWLAIILGISSILTIVLFKKIKKKKLLLIPNILYAVFIILVIVLSQLDVFKEYYEAGVANYIVCWQSVYVAILATTSVVIFIINYIKNKSIDNEGEKNGEGK